MDKKLMMVMVMMVDIFMTMDMALMTTVYRIGYSYDGGYENDDYSMVDMDTVMMVDLTMMTVV